MEKLGEGENGSDIEKILFRVNSDKKNIISLLNILYVTNIAF